jgi:hypothetical protein
VGSRASTFLRMEDGVKAINVKDEISAVTWYLFDETLTCSDSNRMGSKYCTQWEFLFSLCHLIDLPISFFIWARHYQGKILRRQLWDASLNSVIHWISVGVGGTVAVFYACLNGQIYKNNWMNSLGLAACLETLPQSGNSLIKSAPSAFVVVHFRILRCNWVFKSSKWKLFFA